MNTFFAKRGSGSATHMSDLYGYPHEVFDLIKSLCLHWVSSSLTEDASLMAD